jgi:hypothetical protein
VSIDELRKLAEAIPEKPQFSSHTRPNTWLSYERARAAFWNGAYEWECDWQVRWMNDIETPSQVLNVERQKAEALIAAVKAKEGES